MCSWLFIILKLIIQIILLACFSFVDMTSVLLTLMVTDRAVLYVTDGPREVWEAAECGCNLRAYFEDCV